MKRAGAGKGPRGWQVLAAVLLVGAAAIGLTGGDEDAPGTSPGTGGRLSATVVRVVDGDTLDVELNGVKERVRLIGVDTPEVHGSVEHYGAEASAFTKERLTGAAVSLELDVEERDRYGRLLAYLWLGDEMFNETLVREGYAQVMTVPPNVKYADRFVALQQEAREAGRGLWGDDDFGGAAAAPDGDCAGMIKGNISARGEKIYHVPGGQFYDRTVPEECFATREEAEAAGYRASGR